MKTKDFCFDLPEALIAQTPADARGEDRMLVLHKSSGKIEHTNVEALVDYLPKDAVLVINNSKVRKARIYGETEFGGKVEFLFLEERSDGSWEVMTSNARRQKVGKEYLLPGGFSAVITQDNIETKIVKTNKPLREDFFNKHGHVPLPPYIKRDDTSLDISRYQTIYAETTGSVAAPTAGLHITETLLNRIKEKGIQIVPVTLHVGPGTFLPIRSDSIEDHVMHVESYHVSAESASVINKNIFEKKPVFAVGTTSVRTLESAFKDGKIQPGEGKTDLFIYPGYKFSVVTGLLTNFHTPESTLLILVSTFGGKENIMKAYKAAVEKEYMFFSYGDAMLIL